MLSKCANPDCSRPFLYLREGKIFRVERQSGPVVVTQRKPPRSIEHFWLCGPCWENHTLDSDPSGNVRIVPKKPMLVRRAVAS